MSDLLVTIEKTRKYMNPGLALLGIVINQVDGRGLVMEREMEALLRETYRDLVFKTKIGKRVKVEESPAFQKGIADYDPSGVSAKEFKALAAELMRRLKRLEKQRSINNGGA